MAKVGHTSDARVLVGNRTGPPRWSQPPHASRQIRTTCGNLLSYAVDRSRTSSV